VWWSLAGAVVVEAQVALFQPLDAEIQRPDVRRRRRSVLTDLEREAVDGEGVRER
jgi:hypothetical protein